MKMIWLMKLIRILKELRFQERSLKLREQFSKFKTLTNNE